MALFKVEMPDGRILQVDAPDDATDEVIIERAKDQDAAARGPVAPDEVAMNQARILGTTAGVVNTVGTSLPGAIASTFRGARDIATAQPITQNPQAARQAGLLTEGSKIKIGDITRTMANEEVRAMNMVQMSRDPKLAAQEIAPRATQAARTAGNVARKFIGPYGAVTSAADAAQRFNTAQGPMDYLQAGISGVGAAGYGMSALGNAFPPAKVPGMIVGGAADLANMGIDALSEYVRRLALQRAQQQGQQ